MDGKFTQSAPQFPSYITWWPTINIILLILFVVTILFFIIFFIKKMKKVDQLEVEIALIKQMLKNK